MKINFKKIIIAISAIVILAMIIYWFANKESRLTILEDADIVYVSENYTCSDSPSLRLRKELINYFISKDGKVYTLKNKELTEIKELYGAKKIISTLNDTIVLKNDGTLWNYKSDTNKLINIPEMEKCKDIVSGDDNLFYAILKENGEVWLSRNILDEDAMGAYSKNIKVDYNKINFPVKAKSVSCNYDYGAPYGADNYSICILDENNQLWGYGWIYGLLDNSMYKLKKFDNVDKHSSKELGLFISNGNAYVYNFKIFGLAGSIIPYMEKENAFDYKKEDFLIKELEGEMAVDVLAVNRTLGYIKTENGELYKIYDYDYHLGDYDIDFVKQSYKIEKIADIEPNSKIFDTAYGIITIDDNGEIRLYRYYSIFQEWLKGDRRISVRTDELFPWWNLI